MVGEKTLRELVREAKANEHAFTRPGSAPCCAAPTPTTTGGCCRQLLAALEFRCNNTAYRPVMDALELLARYADVRRPDPFYADAEHGADRRGGARALAGRRGRRARPGRADPVRAVRAGRAAGRAAPPGDLRRGRAHRWRNPDDDLPGDFDDHRDVHYAALRQPLDPTEFIAALRTRMTDRPGPARPGPGERHRRRGAITTRRGRAVDHVSRSWTGCPSRANLAAVKDEVIRRWGTIDLLDVLKDADFLTDFTDRVHLRRLPGGDRPRAPLRRRLLLCLFALGTNMGIKRDRRHRRARRDRGRAAPRPPAPFVTRDNLRARDRRGWSTPPSRRATRTGGATGTACAVGLEEVRLLGVQPDDRMARTLRRARRDDLLARRAQVSCASTPSSRPAPPPRSRR